MIERLGRLFRRPRSGVPGDFRTFLDRQAAFVAQKTVLDYCRVKAGLHERQMFANPDFQAALSHCRWQTWAGAVQDVAALAEAWLRPHLLGREAALAEALALLAGQVIEAAPAPPEARATLDAARDGLPRHLAILQEAPPQGADRLPLLAEAPLLATLPIHPDQRIGETPAIRGALRFHIVTTQQEMERAFDAAGLAMNLVAT
jgi:hypothetical protein